jgi:hypothetical protein
MDKRLSLKHDDLNPFGMFGIFGDDLLLGIMNSDDIDPRELIKQELASRGLDKNGLWVGFDRAHKIWGVK